MRRVRALLKWRHVRRQTCARDWDHDKRNSDLRAIIRQNCENSTTRSSSFDDILHAMSVSTKNVTYSNVSVLSAILFNRRWIIRFSRFLPRSITQNLSNHIGRFRKGKKTRQREQIPMTSPGGGGGGPGRGTHRGDVPFTLSNGLDDCGLNGTRYALWSSLAALDRASGSRTVREEAWERPSPSPLRVLAWSRALEHFSDARFTRWLLSGLTNGLRIGCAARTIIKSAKRHHRSASLHPAQVDNFLSAEITAGRILGPLSPLASAAL